MSARKVACTRPHCDAGATRTFHPVDGDGDVFHYISVGVREEPPIEGMVTSDEERWVVRLGAYNDGPWTPSLYTSQEWLQFNDLEELADLSGKLARAVAWAAQWNASLIEEHAL